jgi:hypothetical protein
MFAAKFNSKHELVWQTSYSASSSTTWARTAIVSPSGDRYVVAGFTGSAGASANLNDSVVVQFDTTTGAAIETATFVSAEGERDEAYAATFAPDGSLLVGGTKAAGFTFTYSLRKFSAVGSQLWQRTLAPGAVTAQLNNSIRIARRFVRTNSLGETYVTTWALIDSNGLHATSLKKLSQSGASVWELHFPNTSSDDEFPRELRLDSAGNILLVSDRTVIPAQFANPIRSMLVRKLTPDGVLLWQVSHIDPPSTGFAGRAAAIGSDDSIFVASSMFVSMTSPSVTNSHADWVVRKLSSVDGALLWTYQIDGGNNLDDRAMEIAVDGNAIYVAGLVNNGTDYIPSLRDDNWRLIKLTDGATPVLNWSEISANSGADMVQSMAASAGGDRVYVVGQVTGNDGYVSKFAVGSYATASASRVLFTTQGSDPSSTLNSATDAVAIDGGDVFAVGSLGYANGASGALIVRVDKAGVEICRWAQPAPIGTRPGVFNAIVSNAAGVAATGMWDAADGSSAMVTVQFNERCQPMWFSEINSAHTREIGLAVSAIRSGPLSGRVIAAGYGREPNKPHTAVLQAIDPAVCTLDFDGDGIRSVASDGVIAIRAMNTPVADARFAKEVANKSGMRSAEQAANYALTFVGNGRFDLDGDGTVSPLIDGLVLVRAMLGLSNEAITRGIAFPESATRRVWIADVDPTASNSIGLHLQAVCGL